MASLPFGFRQVAASLLLAVTACPSPQAQEELRLVQLREDARRTLTTYCGECHVPSRPTAAPGALSVFDLSKPLWSERMTDAQLEDALRRLRGDLVPTRGPKEALPLAVPEGELQRFGEFVSSELSHRRRPDSGRRQP